MLSRFVTCLTASYTFGYYLHFKQKNQSGVTGRTGLFVVKSAEVEYLTERENVSHQSVHMLILNTTNVMESIMKRRNVTSSVVQVCQLIVTHLYLLVVYYSHFT